MATALTPIQLNNPFPQSASDIAADITPAAGDTTGNYFPLTANTIIIATNTDSGAHNLVLNSQKDSPGQRTGDITISVGAGKTRVIGPLSTLPGWRDANGNMNVTPASALITLVVVVHS